MQEGSQCARSWLALERGNARKELHRRLLRRYRSKKNKARTQGGPECARRPGLATKSLHPLSVRVLLGALAVTHMSLKQLRNYHRQSLDETHKQHDKQHDADC